MNIIEQIIYPVIDEMNMALEHKLVKSPDTSLLGGDSALDSLGLVTLIVTVESKVNEVSGRTIVLANEKAMSSRNSPFRNVEALSVFIEELLVEQNG